MRKKGYGGKSGRDGSQEWSKQFQILDSPQPVPSQEMNRFRQDFLGAAKRAQKRLRQQVPARKRLYLRLALSSAALIAIMAIGLCMLMTPRVEAFNMDGLQGQVINTADGLPIPNVAVRNLESGRIECTTDTWGVFTVDAHPGKTTRYSLELEQRKIAECKVGTDNDCVTGYQRLSVALPRFKREEVMKVQVAAGCTVAASPEMHVALVSGSPKEWTGQARQQHNWPQVFNYGRVVDGIYSLQGAAVAGLTLSIAVSAERLRALDGKAEDLKVIAYDARYASDIDLTIHDNSVYNYCISGYHRGWFRLDKPHAAYLPRAVPTITPQSDGGAIIEWAAEVGRQYALMLPPEAQGTVTACYVKSEEDPSAHYSKQLLVLDQQRPAMGVYDVEYSNGAESIPVLNMQPLHSQLRYTLESAFVSRDGTSHPAFAQSDGPENIPGEFTVHRYDFTLADGVAYPPIKAEFPQHGEYSIEFDHAKVGEVSQLKVMGDLSRLSEPPRWDLGTDCRDDSFGNSIDLFTPAPAAYKVNVTLREKAGAVVRLSRWIDVEAGAVVGFSSNEYGSVPIIHCSPAPPAAQSRYMAQTAECVVDPLPYGYCTGSSLGPKWLFTPPDTMRGVPLKELRIVVYVLPLGGDTGPDAAYEEPDTNGGDKAVYLSPSVSEVSPVNEWIGGAPGCTNPEFMFGTGIEHDIALTEVSHQLWQCRSLIERVKPGEQQPELEASLASQLKSIKEHLELNQDQCRINGFKLGLGLDLSALPGKHDVAQKLYKFYNSKYYSIRYASRNQPKIEWVIDLHGTRIGPNNSLLVTVPMETQGLLINAQYDLLSGGDTPAGFTLTAADGSQCTQYLDYSAVTLSARQPVKQR